MVDRNEPVGSNLRRFLRGLRNEEAEQYGAGLSEGVSGPVRQPSQAGGRSMREVMRGVPATSRSAAGTAPATTVTAPRAEVPMEPAEMSGPGMAGAEVVREMERRAAARAPARPNMRMGSRRAASPGMSADDLNALSMTRGVSPDNVPDTAAAANIRRRLAEMGEGMKKGGKVKAKAPMKRMKAGGMVKSSCSRGDGIAKKGKTKGRMV